MSLKTQCEIYLQSRGYGKGKHDEHFDLVPGLRKRQLSPSENGMEKRMYSNSTAPPTRKPPTRKLAEHFSGNRNLGAITLKVVWKTPFLR